MVGMKSQDNVSYFTMNKKISKKKLNTHLSLTVVVVVSHEL